MRNQYKVKGKLFNIAFLSPAFLVYTIFMIIPIVFSFYYSLNKWDGIGPKKFVGLKNFIRMFSNSQYLTVTSNTLTLVLLSLLITLPVSLCLAYLLYRCKHGFKFFRLAIFMPVIISAMIVGLIFSILFNADFGPVNQILKDIGLPQLAKVWLTDPEIVLYSVIAPQIWQNVGYYTIIFLADLQSVPESILESARIDGANSFRVFFNIMLPSITEISKIVIVLIVTGALKSFNFSWAMTNGGPGVKSTFFTVYMYKRAFEESNFGMASAVSVVVLAYALVFTVIFNWLYAYLNRDRI